MLFSERRVHALVTNDNVPKNGINVPKNGNNVSKNGFYVGEDVMHVIEEGIKVVFNKRKINLIVIIYILFALLKKNQKI